MQVYLNRIDGWDDFITSTLLSKRSLSRQREAEIRKSVAAAVDERGFVKNYGALTDENKKLLDSALRFCRKHITLGRFLDFSFSVYGIHRAGQDDLDSHAMRMGNRIVRNSTRLADYEAGEKSLFYENKILSTDDALSLLSVEKPPKIVVDGKTYVSAVNGYIREDLADNRDVKRGLYMLSIPSDFIFKINLTEFAHVYKQRCAAGTANPEVKKAVEFMADAIEGCSNGLIGRGLLREIEN